MPGFLEYLYASSPVWLQHVGVSAFGIVWRRRRFGGQFSELLQEFISRESYSLAEWYHYQTERLRQLLAHAVESVPHYREAFHEVGITAQDLPHFTLDNLSKLPLLEKETMRRHLDQFIASNARKWRLHTYFTSGTTGTPLAIRFTSEMHQTFSAAFEARCRRWAGVNYKMSRAMIGGRVVVPNPESYPPFWRYNLAERQLYMSAFHISPSNAPYYVEAINRFEPDYLCGYASSHFLLARMICEMGLKIHQPKAVLTSSEKLLPEMRSTIEQAYHCPVFDSYSSIEACCLVSECEYHRLHVSPDVGIIELLDERGNPVKPEQPGEIVATGLLNFAQPLIRYRTGDLAAWSLETCPCGRQMPIFKEIYGRQEDTVILPDGRRSASFYKVFQGITGIREAQVIQEDYDEFIFYLVTDSHFTVAQREALLKNVRVRYGNAQVDLRIVDRIERTKSGKLRLVISKVHNSSNSISLIS